VIVEFANIVIAVNAIKVDFDAVVVVK